MEREALQSSIMRSVCPPEESTLSSPQEPQPLTNKLARRRNEQRSATMVFGPTVYEEAVTPSRSRALWPEHSPLLHGERHPCANPSSAR